MRTAISTISPLPVPARCPPSPRAFAAGPVLLVIIFLPGSFVGVPLTPWAIPTVFPLMPAAGPALTIPTDVAAAVPPAVARMLFKPNGLRRRRRAAAAGQLTAGQLERLAADGAADRSADLATVLSRLTPCTDVPCRSVIYLLSGNFVGALPQRSHVCPAMVTRLGRLTADPSP